MNEDLNNYCYYMVVILSSILAIYLCINNSNLDINFLIGAIVYGAIIYISVYHNRKNYYKNQKKKIYKFKIDFNKKNSFNKFMVIEREYNEVVQSIQFYWTIFVTILFTCITLIIAYFILFGTSKLNSENDYNSIANIINDFDMGINLLFIVGCILILCKIIAIIHAIKWKKEELEKIYYEDMQESS